MLMSYLEDGAYYCRGTWQNLALALAEAIRRGDGEVLLSTQVRRILVDRRGVAGVLLQNGQTIRASTVISNADASETFEELVGAPHLPARFLRKLRGMKPSLSAFVLFLATDLDLKALGARHQMIRYNTWDHEAAYRSTLTGVPAGIGVDSPTLIDPTLAPPGHHLVIATSLIPYDVGASWREEKAKYSERMMDELEAMFPGLRAHTKMVEGASPRTMERYTLNLSGAIYGWEASPDQVGPGRLSHRTLIEGLFLSGHWTQPGGGIYAVALSPGSRPPP